ncbi:WD40 repeat domain-containing protein [Allocoleopsis sp.]|uniref:WD40 repeat domain-containing protein n=1 Tax=Allocoleopsis sp. TaxID=3088169 RepID=UPI002FD02D61
MEEPTQQPSDNSIRQANSIETEAELDAAILAAIERANETHTVESSDNASDSYIDAGFDIVLIDPSEVIESPDDEHEALSGPVPISPSVEDEMLSQFSADDSPSMLMGMMISSPSLAEEMLCPFGADDSPSMLLGMMISPSYQEYEAEDLSPQIPIAPPVEEVKLPQPQSDDAVLGGQNPTLASSLVLGGLEGVKRRLASTAVEPKIAALKEALKYGQAGLDLVIQALKNESKSIAKAVYWELRGSSEPLAQKALKQYNPYQFLECIFSGDLANNGTNAIAISPDSQTLVCGCNKDIVIWNLHTGKWLRTLKGHFSLVYCVTISPDGQTLASSSQDRTIKLWNLHTGKQLHTLKGHSIEVTSVAISPDGLTLVSGSLDGTIKRWNLSTGQELQTLKGHSSEVNFLAISPDNVTLVSQGTDRMDSAGRTRTIKLWNLHTGKERSTLKMPLSRCAAISPDHLTWVTGSRDGGIKLWNPHTRTERNTLQAFAGQSEFVSALAISPDGQTLFTGSYFGTIKLWNMVSGKQLHTIEGHSSDVSSMAVSPDGQTLVSTSDDGTIKVWR